MTNSALFLSHSGNLCQTSVSKAFTFTANLLKEQLMTATGRVECFYRAPFITNTHFHTKNAPVLIRRAKLVWDQHEELSLRHALAWSARRLLYTTKYNTASEDFMKAWWRVSKAVLISSGKNNTLVPAEHCWIHWASKHTSPLTAGFRLNSPTYSIFITTWMKKHGFPKCLFIK